MKKYVSLILMSITTFCFAQTSVETLVADYERAKAMSLEYVEAMPEDLFSNRPTEGVRTFAEQFLHASQGTIGLVSNGTGADRIYATANLEKDPKLQSKEEVKRMVTESFDFAIASIKNMDESTFGEIVERGPFKITRLAWIQKAHEHISHHRGQAAIYLRMNGIVPPQYKLF
ncbi:DinB family protein [Ekhidna sp. MALMAid0563]|uniref:DinB family protein n=1 Tax=Ekhidna sp. MALMAid0563 TaxID=3143937 RepID=UPI0032DE370A